MNKFFIRIAVLMCLWLSAGSLASQRISAIPYATDMPWPQSLQAGLDSLLQDSLFETTMVGMCVYDLTADSLLYSHNARQRLRPASTMKLITAVAALDLPGGLPPYATELRITGEVKNGTLCGDLYVVGGFDPCFDREDMKAFREALIQAGIDSVSGRVVADVSMKDTLKWGSGWCWDDECEVLTPLPYNKSDEFLSVLCTTLAEGGIRIGVVPDKAECPSSSRLLVRRTHPVDQILLTMMKESDNLYAESMFYRIAAHGGQKYASARQAREIINNLIRRMGFRPEDYRIADGSGLSLYNYLTPELELAFLRYAYARESVFYRLYPSLPVAGEDGTLKKRMRTGSARGNVRAKTGTVEGVATLAGYARSSNGHLLAFSIMNQGISRARQGRDFQDSVCQWLCR
ncbi:MAG: D-alanyl-D-alanine carboxypeptidase/D-alanyl-D-alanine-endopeptidase [Clostridium sp.]|nr:D-alanyl-D-alanine carboxypeptidase/D-alanyl-D-alanine-endopeptidase [Clostridium sp.]